MGKNRRFTGGLMVLSIAWVCVLFSVPALASAGQTDQPTDYFHQGLGHSTPVPAWAKGRHIYFLAPPSRSPAREIAQRGYHYGGSAIRDNDMAVGASSPSGKSAGLSAESLLSYGNGSVQHNPHIHVIYWGSNWNQSGGPQEVRESLNLLYQGLNNSDYQKMLGQYFDNAEVGSSYPSHIEPTVQFNPASDVYVDTRVSAPSHLGEGARFSEIEKEISEVIGLAGWTEGPNEQFVLLTPPGTTYESKFLTFCGFHAILGASTYTFIPYPGASPGCESGTAAASASRTASHEYAESLTDPGGSFSTHPGWAIAVTDENGKVLGYVEAADYCDLQPSGHLANGATVEPLKDNFLTMTAPNGTIHCEVSGDPSPAKVSVGETTMQRGRPGQITLESSLEPAGYNVNYFFESYDGQGWGKLAGTEGTVGGIGNVKVKRSEVEVHSSSKGFRLAAELSVGGTAFGKGLYETPEWETMLCGALEFPCHFPNRLAAGSVLSASASSSAAAPIVELRSNENSAIKVECLESGFQLTTGGEMGEPLPFTLSGLSFGKCTEKDALGNTSSCNVSAPGLPYSGAIAWRASDEGWSPSMGAGSNQEPSWHLECSGKAPPVDCTYKFKYKSSLVPTFKIMGGAPAQAEIRAEGNENFVTEGKECSRPMIRTGATYSISSPSPLHVVARSKLRPHVTRIEAESYPVSLAGQQDPTNKLAIELESKSERVAGCEKANLNAGSVFATSEPRLKPEYQGCTTQILGNHDLTEILPNSCEYTIGIANTAPSYSATFGIACAKEGDGIELKVYTSAKTQAEGKTLCAYKIAPKSGLKGIGLSNFGSGTERGVSAKFESISIPYTKVSGTVTNCGAASASAIFTGTSKLLGTTGSQAPVGVYVNTGEPTVGFYVAGEKEPKFEAEKYPVAVAGEQSSTERQTFEQEGTRKIECSSAYLNASSSAASSSLTLKPEYQGCTIEILGNHDLLEILPNSCEYTMGIANTAPPYSATFGIACAKEGDGIELKVYAGATQQAEGKTLCAYKIAPKSGLKGIGLSNFGSGTERGVSAKFESISIPYTKVSGTVTNCGAASASAILKGTTVMRGF